VEIGFCEKSDEIIPGAYNEIDEEDFIALRMVVRMVDGWSRESKGLRLKTQAFRIAPPIDRMRV
jgi:hypothetical protein